MARVMTSVVAFVALCAFLFLQTAAGSAAERAQIKKSPLDLAKERTSRGATRGKIILGRPAPEGAYPFQVSLIEASVNRGSEFDGHFCGGTLIAPNWVLTASHCVTSNGEASSAKDINVYVGSQNFRKGERIPVKAIFRHPKYDGEIYDNDVALLQIANAPKTNVKFGVVKLIDASNESALTAPGANIIVIGWGTTEKDQLSQTLQHATIKMADRAQCNKGILDQRIKDLDDRLSDVALLFRITKERLKSVHDAVVSNAGSLVTDGMICAGDLAPAAGAEKAKDSCQGDSGGPILTKGPDGALVQVGIVSWGEGCGIPQVYGVYTRLAKYMDWVKSTARD